MRSKHVLTLFSGLGVAAVVACTDVPLAPKWSADILFPIQFPDVVLGGANGVAKGSFIPPASVSDTSAISIQEVSGATKQLLDESVNSINADVVFATSADLTGSIVISVAPDSNNLFSANKALALTVTIPVRKTAGDTQHVAANVAVFQTQSQSNNIFGGNTSSTNSSNVLYTRSRTTVACRAGLCTVTSADKLQLGINLTANIAVSK